MKPDAPVFGTHDMLLHQTYFFATPEKLLRNPFYLFAENAPRLGEYLPYLVSIPTSILAAVSVLYLAVRRNAPGIVVSLVALAPLAVQLFVLTFFPTRYPYAFLWPWLLVSALATIYPARRAAAVAPAEALRYE